MIAVQPLAAQVGVAPACQALGVSRASFYRRQRSTPGHQQPRPTPARALCEAEREQILDVLAGPRFVDRAPAEVVATLLDEGHYLCSERTMYRILAADQPVRERRNQREHPQYTKPELVATAPNQTWSWDITKLLGPTKWTYFYLYVVLDIFSRYAVGWMVADRENSALAGRLTASRSPLPARNDTDRDAGTATLAPVAGLRPLRAGRSFAANAPNPESRTASPRASAPATASSAALTAASAAAGDSPVSSATCRTSSDRFIPCLPLAAPATSARSP